MMPFLRDFIDQQLQWKRLHVFSSNYELRDGDQILATFNSSGILKKRSVAEAEDQQWTFKRTGFTRNKFLIYSGGPETLNKSTQPLAWIQTRWRKDGELIFPTGDTYTWVHTGIWRPTWSWNDGYGTTLLTLKKNRLLEIMPAASEIPHLALLTVFGFYLLRTMEEDEAAANAASSV